jgi:hypothetical protein
LEVAISKFVASLRIEDALLLGERKTSSGFFRISLNCRDPTLRIKKPFGPQAVVSKGSDVSEKPTFTTIIAVTIALARMNKRGLLDRDKWIHEAIFFFLINRFIFFILRSLQAVACLFERTVAGAGHSWWV